MKFLTFLAIISFSFSVHAQNISGLLQQFQGMDMQQMQAELTRVAGCMQQVDQQKLKDLEKRGKAVMEKVESLCKKGKVKEAERYSKREVKRVMDSPTAKKLRECSEGLVSQLGILSDAEKDGPVCD